MKTAVEWYCEKSIDILEKLRAGKMTFDKWFKEQAVILKQAKEMEKEQLLQMSLKSAHYERKWIVEHSTESKYNPSKVEIRDLEKTALEHYNETFKQQEQ
jgi:hypothetical protein